MAGRVLVQLLLALLLSSAVATIKATLADQNGDPLITHEHLMEHITALMPQSGAPVDPAELPVERPPLTWTLCDYSSCMSSLSIRQDRGVYTLDMAYKPLAGVTSSMMVWLLENLHKDMVLPSNGKVYPMYLVFHGVDHLHHDATPPTNVGQGTVFTWNEIPLTRCTYHRLSATQPWVCGERTGFVRSDPKSLYDGLFHTKVEMVVTRFDAGGMEFIRKEVNPFFGADGRTVVTTRHTWSDSPSGLLLRTQQWLGVMAPGSNTVFDTSALSSVANIFVKNAYLGSATNVPRGNITAAAYMAALHYLQEYGSLGQWLPQAYTTNNVVS